jgi:peptidoglycan/LPS O-acetylase OafA/YrhL
MSTPRIAVPRLPGLDGMRAIAVALVVVYHLFPQSWLRGGFIGVDVFFVISGFLITTLLLREEAGTGRLSLVGFWQRRARRLLPALGLVVTICATAAWLIGGDVLVDLGPQVLGAATFSYNWVSIADGGGYFSAATPELFRNLWSLAVEEQFYVLWPLVLPLFLLLPRIWGRVAAALALCIASAVCMGMLVSAGGDLTRAYFGTDTHAFGILLGIALAFGLQGVLDRAGSASRPPAALPEYLLAPGWKVVAPTPAAPRPDSESTRAHLRVRVVTGIGGTVAVVGLVALAMLPPADTAVTFPGTLLAASVLSAVAIAAGVWPGSAFGRAIDVRPLRWIGDRSYGLYLWHWPLLVLLMAGVSGTSPAADVPVWVGAVALTLTIAAAETSYRLVETPVRRHGFRGSLARVGARIAGSPVARLRALAAIAATVAVLGGTSAAIAASPDMSSGQSVVEAGAAALEAASAEPAPDGSGGPGGSGAPAPALGVDGSTEASPGQATTPGADSAPGGASAPEGGIPSPTLSPTPITGDEITAIGDSVMLASAPGLLTRFPGIQVDAAVSRSMWAGPSIAQALADAGQLRPFLVIALGTNGPVDAGSLEQFVQIAGPDRRLVLVNAFAPRSWIPGVNTDLAAFAASHPGVAVADWAAAIAPHVDLLAGDEIHPGDAGGRIFADCVAEALDRLETERALEQYAGALRAYRLNNGIVAPVPQ